MTPTKKKNVVLKQAKENLKLNIPINGKIYELNSDLFDLDTNNIANLNFQISKIPGELAWITTILDDAETRLARLEYAFDLWKAEKLSLFWDEKSESAKLTRVKTDFKAEWKEYYSPILELGANVKLLKAYKNALEIKYSLAQTLAANNRKEMDVVKSGGSL